MASPLGHSMMGVAIFFATVKPIEWFKRWGWFFLLMLFSAAADLDYLPAVFNRFDLAERFHRKFTHTLLFAGLATVLYIIVTALIYRKIMWKAASVLLAALIIHLVIDIVSLDEREPYGIAIFEPFNSQYLYSPVVIFPNIEKDSYSRIINLHNIKTALFEVVFFGALIPATAAFSALITHRKTKNG
jgi:membrane-bound metal-dependent hydrolase YbcI (DUF457 family)